VRRNGQNPYVGDEDEVWLQIPNSFHELLTAADQLLYNLKPTRMKQLIGNDIRLFGKNIDDCPALRARRVFKENGTEITLTTFPSICANEQLVFTCGEAFYEWTLPPMPTLTPASQKLAPAPVLLSSCGAELDFERTSLGSANEAPTRNVVAEESIDEAEEKDEGADANQVADDFVQTILHDSMLRLSNDPASQPNPREQSPYLAPCPKCKRLFDKNRLYLHGLRCGAVRV